MKRRIAWIAAAVVLGVVVLLLVRWSQGEGPSSSPRTSDVTGGAARGGGSVVRTVFDVEPRPRGQSPDDARGEARLEGRVIDADGTPVEGATVVISSAPIRVVASEGDGSFVFEGLLPRVYTLEARFGDDFGGPVKVRAPERHVTLRLTPRSAIRVNVVDDVSSAPIAGARVRVDLNLLRIQTTTDADGVAWIRGVPYAFAVVEVVADGYAQRAQPLPIAGRAGVTEAVTLRLLRGVSISGTVVDDQDQPVANARVRLSDFEIGELDTVSAADGTWRLAGVPAGEHVIEASHAIHAESMIAVTVEAGKPVTGVVIRFGAGVALSGRVIDEGGRGVAAANVYALGGNGHRRSTSAADGRFEIGGLDPGGWTLWAEQDPLASDEVLVVVADAPGDVVLTLRDGTIGGIVVDSAGRPVAGAEVSATASVLRLNGSNLSLGTDVSDREGRFSIRPLIPGAYRLRAELAQPDLAYGLPPSQVEARTGDREVRLVLDPAGSVRGRVVDAEHRPRDSFRAQVAVEGARFGLAATPFVGTAGVFTFDGVPSGRVRVRIKGESLDPVELDEIEVKPGRTTDVGDIVVLGSRTVSGRVIDESGAPVDGALVVAGTHLAEVDTGFDASSQTGGVQRAMSGADGGFTISGVAPQDASVIADHPERGRSLPVRVPDGSDARVEVRLGATGALEGRVTRGGQALPSGPTVSAQAVSGGPALTTRLERGSYRFDRLAPGEHLVSVAWHDSLVGVMDQPVTVRAGATSRLDLQVRPGNATVMVTIPDAPPVTRVGMFAGSDEGHGPWWSQTLWDEKSIDFTDVPSGDYTVCAGSPRVCAAVAVTETPPRQQVVLHLR